MAFALVASVSVTGSGGTQTTPSIDTTGADLLIVCLSDYAVPAVYSVSDNKGNTWIQAGSSYHGPSGVDRVVTFYAKNPIVGSGHTFSLGVTGHYAPIFVQAWSGAHLTAPFGGEVGLAGGSSASTWQPGSVTPTEDNCLIHLAIAPWLNAPSSIDSGFTLLNTQVYSGGASFAGGDGYKVQTTAAAVNPTVTFASGTDGTLMQSWWKPAGGSSSPIAGRTTITTRTAGTLVGAAAAAGSSRVALRTTGARSAAGSLTGSTRISERGHAAATGAGALSGSSRTTIAASGALSVAAFMTGAVRIVMRALGLAGTTLPDSPTPAQRVLETSRVRVLETGTVRAVETARSRVAEGA